MTLSSDELQILEYLKSWKGSSISMIEICRSAGGRKKFRETPHWAKGMMARLVDARLVHVNDRGHYRFISEEDSEPQPAITPAATAEPVGLVDDNYFPMDKGPLPPVVGEDYFPEKEDSEKKSERWISSQMLDILKKSGKNFGLHEFEE